MSAHVTTWPRHIEPDAAVARILEAAERAFVDLGVSAAGMAEIAEYAGCSRRTIYRYFPTRHELHLAYVRRATARILTQIQATAAEVSDPQQRIVNVMMVAIREVREHPGTAAWFAPGVSELAARMSHATEIQKILTGAFVREFPDAGVTHQQQQAQWMIRVILSFLSMPGKNSTEERALIQRFAAPVLT